MTRTPTTWGEVSELTALQGLSLGLELVAGAGHLPSSALTARLAELANGAGDLEPDVAYQLLTPPLCGPHPQLVLQWLLDCGWLQRLLPELVATVALSQEGGRRHKDVWEHTKTVVLQAVPRPVVRWAAVLHDIGKVTTRRFTDQGRVTFYGHSEEGVRIFLEGPARRIGFSPEMSARIEFLILHHLRPGQYESGWGDPAVRRFDREMGTGLTDLLDLSRADITSRRPGRRRACLARISELSRRIHALREADAQVAPLPTGLGRVLMTEMGLAPGPALGQLRGQLERLCCEGVIEAGREPAYYIKMVYVHDLVATANV